MGKLMENLQRLWEKGEETGAEKGLVRLIQTKLAKGKGVSIIAEELEITGDEVENLVLKYDLNRKDGSGGQNSVEGR